MMEEEKKQIDSDEILEIQHSKLRSVTPEKAESEVQRYNRERAERIKGNSIHNTIEEEEMERRLSEMQRMKDLELQNRQQLELKRQQEEQLKRRQEEMKMGDDSEHQDSYVNIESVLDSSDTHQDMVDDDAGKEVIDSNEAVSVEPSSASVQTAQTSKSTKEATVDPAVAKKLRIVAEHEAARKAHIQNKSEKLRTEAEAEAARLQAIEEERLRQEAELEAARLQQEQEERVKLEAEQEAQRLRQEAQEAKQKAELEAARLQKEEEELAKLEAEAEAERLRVEAKIQAEKEASKMRMQQLEEERKRLELERQAMTLKAEEEEQARINAQNELARLKAEQADRQKFLDMQMTIDEGHSFDMSQFPLEEKPIVSDDEEESTAPFETEEEETLSTYESYPEIFAFAARPSSAGSNRLSRPGSASLQRKRRQQQRTENALQGMLAKMSSSMSLRSDDRSVTSFSTVETSLVSHTRNLSSENVKWESITIPVWFGLLTNEYGAPREGQYTPSMSNNHTLLKNILHKMSTVSKKVIEQENASGNMVMKCELPYISRIERDSNFHDAARPDVIRNLVYVSIPVKMTDINEQMNSTAERMARVMICRSLRKSVERKYFS
ncbi:hypothetical protein CTEN210_06812 [Chaetoceros tenuissimus]|uniref:Uncharacterized protein n=1 Tax=Chaetoceros tenuissimus TaxID=426638 RepID=A0AAD3CQK0_9STRA|nr:hypothetical protein CTEN210_06812 [Chaetoceros tenuissimus]